MLSFETIRLSSSLINDFKKACQPFTENAYINGRTGMIPRQLLKKAGDLPLVGNFSFFKENSQLTLFLINEIAIPLQNILKAYLKKLECSCKLLNMQYTKSSVLQITKDAELVAMTKELGEILNKARWLVHYRKQMLKKQKTGELQHYLDKIIVAFSALHSRLTNTPLEMGVPKDWQENPITKDIKRLGNQIFEAVKSEFSEIPTEKETQQARRAEEQQTLNARKGNFKKLIENYNQTHAKYFQSTENTKNAAPSNQLK